jgi:hypothetical protein
MVDNQISVLRGELAAEEEDLKALLLDETARDEQGRRGRSEVERHRQGARVVFKPASASPKKRAARAGSNGRPGPGAGSILAASSPTRASSLGAAPGRAEP